VLRERLGIEEAWVDEVDAPRGPGNIVFVVAECEHLTEVFTGFGEQGVPAATVAERLAQEVLAWRDSGVPVGTHLADQLLVPMVLAGGGRFGTLAPSSHTTTNIALLRQFTRLPIEARAVGEAWELTVGHP